MKFYYEGKLIRTSKTHEYKYAAISSSGHCLKCSATKQGAQAELDRIFRESMRNLEFYRAALQALEIGEARVRNSRGEWIKLDTTWYKPEELRKWIKSIEENAPTFYERNKVVELEARP